jgi:signal transduction histidine kinase/CheY-like chemotaxis protein
MMYHINKAKGVFLRGNVALHQRIAELEAREAESKQVKEALRESEQKYRSLFQNAPIPIWEEDITAVGRWLEGLRANGVVDFPAYLHAHPEALRHAVSLIRVLNVNDASLSMFEASDKQELLSRFPDIFSDETYECFTQALLAIWEGKNRFDLECVALTLKGHRINHVLRWWIPTVSNHPDLSRVIVTAIDITERVRLEEQLRQSQKLEAIGTLAGGIAHDFNNTLFAMIGYTELAMGDIPQGSKPWQYLQEVLKAGTRAKKLVQQILAFSRKSSQERKPVQLRPLIQETLKMLRASLPTTIDIRQDISAEAGTVLADPTQLQQVLMNLCANAEHAMRETGGVLEVRADAVDIDADFASHHRDLQPGPYVRLMVRDTGHGIAPEIRERIFEPFFTTKKAGEGTGMGLAVVHGIVANHSGAITVQSTPGEGTVFTIYFPRIDETIESVTQPAEPIPHGEGCVLFVDDEDTLAQLGQIMLEHLGYHVVSKTSSIEALEAFRATPQRFDLVITDQTMPHMTGEALARELRDIRPDIPIILCTGFSHTANAERARALGIDAFCTKPFVARDLAVTVQQVLGQRAAQKH